MAIIYLIRHGQAQFGMEDYDALSPLGIEQAKYLGMSLKERSLFPDKVFSGKMKRHLQTAEHSLEALSFDPNRMLLQEAWNEFDHRDILAKYNPRYSDIHKLKRDVMFSLNPKKKIQEILTGAVTRWTSGEAGDYNESWEAFTARVEGGLEQLVADSGKKDQVFIYTSGGTISVIMRKVLGLSIEKTFELQLLTANASVTRIKSGSRGLQLLSFNDHSHFEGEKKHLISFR